MTCKGKEFINSTPKLIR